MNDPEYDYFEQRGNGDQRCQGIDREGRRRRRCQSTDTARYRIPDEIYPAVDSVFCAIHAPSWFVRATA